MDLSLVKQFLRLVVASHQRTVRRLAETPQMQNPTRSFENFLPHLELVKQISVQIQLRKEWYTEAAIRRSSVMRTLWDFIGYCEAYYDDCYLVKRCHLNLLLLVITFTNIINVSKKDRHKAQFKQQRQSMLPPSARDPQVATALL